VRQRHIRLAVAVDVGQRAAFGVIAVGDEVLLPHHARLLRVLVPPHPVGHPPGRHHIRRAVMIYIDRPFSAVGDEFSHILHCPELVPCPLPAIGSGILIPVRPTQQIREPVTVHIDRRDSFGMVRSQTVYGKYRLHVTIRSRPRMRLAYRLLCARRANSGCAQQQKKNSGRHSPHRNLHNRIPGNMHG
jgi:hypothetical protein